MKEKGGEGEGRGRAAEEQAQLKMGAHKWEECALSTGQKEKAQQKFK
jgi:hypothetical protein